jgi:hypothetical protein
MTERITAETFRRQWNFNRYIHQPWDTDFQAISPPPDPRYTSPWQARNQTRISSHPSDYAPPAPSPPSNRKATILGRLRTATEPPKVRLFRLPSHRLLTLEPSADSAVYLRVYAGNPRDWSETTEVMLEKVGRTSPGSGRFPWVERRLLDFMREHCHSCPHMMCHTMHIGGANYCTAGSGDIHNAFTDNDSDGNPICLDGHQRPVYTEGDGRRAPITFIPRLPINYGVKLTPDGVYNRDTLNVRYLLEHEGAFYRGHPFRAFNTWNTGAICWGSGQEPPELAETTDRIYRSIFNLDLIEDYRGTIRNYRVADKQYRDVLATSLTPGQQPTQQQLTCLKAQGFTPIPDSTILSLNNEVNGLLLVDKDDKANAFYALAASGAAVEGSRILLPLKQHVIQAGNSFISGYITPIMPAIGRCWFLQPSNNSSRSIGNLLGQIDPPEFPE